MPWYGSGYKCRKSYRVYFKLLLLREWQGALVVVYKSPLAKYQKHNENYSAATSRFHYKTRNSKLMAINPIPAMRP
ncbi:MAG TPA: hypothetical protein DCM62_10330 [Bacteroidales bacterium]|nr:hypothetical protein [Bacteroidales bacterium]